MEALSNEECNQDTRGIQVERERYQRGKVEYDTFCMLCMN